MNYKAIYQNLVNDAAITAIVNTRVYHDAPAKTPTDPYIVFSRVTDNQDNETDYTTERWQVNIFGKLRPTNQSATLENLKDLVIANLNNKRGTLGSGANTQRVKSTEFIGAQEIILPDNTEKQIAIDFYFHYLRF